MTNNKMKKPLKLLDHSPQITTIAHDQKRTRKIYEAKNYTGSSKLNTTCLPPLKMPRAPPKKTYNKTAPTQRSWRRFKTKHIVPDQPLKKHVRAHLLLLANASDTAMDLSGSTRARSCKISLRLSNFRMPNDLPREAINLKQFELTLREHIFGGWREPPHETHHSRRILRTYHTHFGVPLGIAPGWRDDRKKSQACVTYRPSLRYFQQSQPCTLLPSPFWP